MASYENEIQESSESKKPSKVNPYMMPQIVERILNGLDSVDDLLACYDVCREWRKLAPPFILEKLEIRVTEDADYNEELQNYLQMILEFPNLNAQKYVFEDAEFSSKTVKRILKECGQEMKKLTLAYSTRNHKYDDDFTHLASTSRPGDPDSLISTRDFHDLLLNKAPFLEILILKAIPGYIIRTKIFPAPVLLQLKSDQTRQLLLRRIIFNLNKMPTFGSDFSTQFVDDLFSICPKLEDVIVEGYKDSSTIRTSRIKQLKKLKIAYMSQEIMELLNDNLAHAQLESCFLGNCGNVTSGSMQQFLNQQSPSLQQLQLSLENTGINFPPMPKLTLLILLAYKRRTAENDAEPVPLVPLQNFHLHFPSLCLLQLEKSWDFVQEILPTHLVLIEPPPSKTLQVLQTLPLGVNESMMERLGKLFPNLTKLRTGIPFGSETLLISVWKTCPNLTDLFLSLNAKVGRGDEVEEEKEKDDKNHDGNQESKPTLGSIFSGIPDHVFQANFSSENNYKKLKGFDFNRIRSSPSICELKKLRRLYIGGFGPALMHWNCTAKRADLLTDFVGYSTLAYLGPEITFFQMEWAVHKLSERCQKFIGTKMRLTKDDRFPIHFRLIKSGCGYEQIGGFPPLEWLGYGQYEKNGDDNEPQWL